ncbi:hypothetical protein GGI03_005759, partial [Coemansia sp. RSA 2337]
MGIIGGLEAAAAGRSGNSGATVRGPTDKGVRTGVVALCKLRLLLTAAAPMRSCEARVVTAGTPEDPSDGNAADEWELVAYERLESWSGCTPFDLVAFDFDVAGGGVDQPLLA